MGEGKVGRYTSGKLATLLGVSANSVKNWSDVWERDGTLASIPRTPGGHRIYNEEHYKVFRLKLGLDKPSPAPEAGSSA